MWCIIASVFFFFFYVRKILEYRSVMGKYYRVRRTFVWGESGKAKKKVKNEPKTRYFESFYNVNHDGAHKKRKPNT